MMNRGAKLLLMMGGVGMTLGVSPTSLSASGTTASRTTGSASVTVLGGTGPFTYLWERVSGDASTSATAGTSASSAFSRSGMTSGSAYESVWRCKVTDTGSGEVQYTGNVAVSLSRDEASPLSVSLSPSSRFGSRSGPGSVNINYTSSVGGGTGPYTYSWSAVDSHGIAITGGSSANPSFNVALANGEIRSGRVDFTVTDTSTGARGSTSASWQAASSTV